MVNYQNSKIYKLYSPSKNIVYIGSTTQILCKRLVEHLSKYKAYKNDNSKNYLTSFLVLDCEDYKIELLEDYACNNKQQLEKKEGEYIKNNECVNNRIAGRSRQEYYIDNADELREQAKQYNNVNKEKIKEHSKQYRITNADKIKERKKQYRINNIDKIKEYDRQRYLNKKAEKQ